MYSRPLPFILALVSSSSYATGLNFWESSASNSALASANGAKAIDASILATAPSSMTQLKGTTVTANVTYYQVTTDYNIFGKQSQKSQASPIPAGFMVTPINDKWYFGLAAYSRTAADISLPDLAPLPISELRETRVRPIVVSLAPSVAYRHNDVSIALTAEYLYGDYLLEQQNCGLFQCNGTTETSGNTSGWSGALSATWAVNQAMTLAIAHRFDSQFGDDEIQFQLPSITSVYGTIQINEQLQWHNTFSLSRWNGQGIHYQNYSDPVGLLRGHRHSKRAGTSMSYDWDKLTLRGGLSIDEAIDSYGGNDIRYRIGLAYRFTQRLTLDVTGFKEDYAEKQFSDGKQTLVNVSNNGVGVSVGISYQFN
ncbi:OmpP1/FadL family transporter [Vibrio methylphosphonaticus]|uniref:OmpP1/FadL family transporter n=1 Tax=Vibrio methylphosphonaticus TaxID=2946866 RepID=UPI00202A1D54|nr:outer membrane protein transport protein [Vibrio methylphosphonaticus]MCL9773502.1 outer membrane protein transport protein [Vibrio methylphosphonaticus]